MLFFKSWKREEKALAKLAAERIALLKESPLFMTGFPLRVLESWDVAEEEDEVDVVSWPLISVVPD